MIPLVENLYHNMNSFILWFWTELNTREKATVTWLIIFLVLLSVVSKNFRQIYRVFLHRHLILLFLYYISYCTGLYFLLKNFSVWDKALNKDGILWVATYGVYNLIYFTKISENNLVKNLLSQQFRLTMIVGFFINSYCFPFWGEIIFLPLTLIGVVISFTEKGVKLGKFMLLLLFVFSFMYSVVEAINSNWKIFTVFSLNIFLLPTLLYLANIPFVYALALISEYNKIYVKINYHISDTIIKKELKYLIFKSAHFHLHSIKKINLSLKIRTHISMDNYRDEINQILTS